MTAKTLQDYSYIKAEGHIRKIQDMAKPLIKQQTLSKKRKKELAEMPYKDYLYSPEWKAITKAMKQMYPVCQICGEPESLETHHNNYPPRGTESPQDLIVLCHKCHTIYHREGNEISTALRTAIDRCSKDKNTRENLLFFSSLLYSTSTILDAVIAEAGYQKAEHRK